MTKPAIGYSIGTKLLQLQPVRIPMPVGFWRLCKGTITTKLPIYEKPTSEQIKNTEAMFGWVFEDVQP